MQLSSHQEIQILHVDDDPSITDLTGTFLEREDDRFAVATATSADEGLEMIADRPPDCVVSDYNIPGMDGIEFLQAVRKEHPDLPFILYTGKGSEAVASEAIAADVTDYLQKKSGTEQYELLANRIENAVQSRYESERAERQEQLMRLTEFAGETGGFEIDVDSGDILLTDGTRRLVGLSDDTQITLEEAIELYHPDDQADVRQTVTRAAEAGEETRGPWRLQTPDGDERFVEVTMVPTTENGDVTTLRGAIHDVTERRKRRQELEQIETLFQHAQDSLFLIDVAEELTVERVNPAYENVTGLSADRLHGRTPREILGEQQGATVERRYRDCVEHEEPLEYTEQLRFDGDLRQWETRIAPVVLDGSVEYIVGATRDVTDREERQQELQRLQQAIDDANVSITLADPSQEDEPLVYVNDNFEQTTGYSPEETLGRNCRFLQGEDTDPEKVAALREAVDNEEPVSVELRNYRKDGTEFWNRVTIAPIYDDRDELVRYLGTQQDVTERKERERELREERRFIEQALDTLDDLFYVLDTNGSFRRWNERTVEVTGYTDSELADMQALELFPEDEHETIADAIQLAVSGEKVTVEADLLGADGERRPYELTGARLTDAEGNTTGLVGIGRDLTDIREQQRRFRALTEESADVISVVDTEARFKYASPSWSQLGYDPEEVIGEVVWEFVHPDDRAELMEKFETGIADPSAHPVAEFRVKHADGSWRWFEGRGNNQLDNSAVEGYVVNKRDVTERKEREQEILRKSRALENAPVGVTMTDPNHENNPMIFANERFEQITGHEKAEIIGRNHRFLQGRRTASEPVTRMRKAIDNREQVSVELRNYRKDGTEFWSQVDISPVFDEAGDLVNFVGFQQDITGRKQREQQIQVFNRILRHNLRNRLNVARAYLGRVASKDRARAGESDGTATEASAVDGVDVEPALNAIEDLVDLSEKSKELHRAMSMDTERQEIELCSYLSGLVAEIGESFPDASLSFEQPEHVVLTAFPSLRVAFEEILENAAKHAGPEPSISVAIEERADTAEIQISDDGNGLSTQDQRVLAEGSETPLMHGSGLGLWMVSWIVTSHGGSLGVDASEDGTTVRISLPRSSTETASVSVATEPELQQARGRFETIFEESFDAMVITGPDGNYIEVNSAASELFGRTERQLMGTRLTEVAENLDRAQVEAAMESGRERDQFTLRRPDGAERFVEYSVTPNIVSEQHLFVFRDVTERNRREQALTARTEELERQNERLNEFASLVSHDLRNPLNVATKQLEQARAECASAHLSKVAAAHHRMDELIGDVLDLARAGRVLGDVESVELTAIVARCWQKVESKDASLAIEREFQLRADPSRFQQLMANLLRNAIEHGGDDVSITVSQCEDGDGFYVADDGPGISTEVGDEIFESGYSTQKDGTGFGLAIVEEIVDAHNWSIEVLESEDGGARFEITDI